MLLEVLCGNCGACSGITPVSHHRIVTVTHQQYTLEALHVTSLRAIRRLGYESPTRGCLSSVLGGGAAKTRTQSALLFVFSSNLKTQMLWSRISSSIKIARIGHAHGLVESNCDWLCALERAFSEPCCLLLIHDFSRVKYLAADDFMTLLQCTEGPSSDVTLPN